MLISKVRKRLGRGAISQEVRDLIFQMVTENPTWGAPRIHGELLMLGFDVSERTISRWMKRAPKAPDPSQAVARLSSKSPGSHCLDGFIRGSDGHVPRALLLLRRQP